jgi:hypothetical protein
MEPAGLEHKLNLHWAQDGSPPGTTTALACLPSAGWRAYLPCVGLVDPHVVRSRLEPQVLDVAQLQTAKEMRGRRA